MNRANDIARRALIDDNLQELAHHASNKSWLAGYLLLHEAMDFGSEKAIEYLLQTDWLQDINSLDDWGHTPLSLACRNDRTAVVNILLANGADPNAIDGSAPGYTALSHAVMNGNIELVRTLLNSGADPRLEGWMHLSAFDKAIQRKEETHDEMAVAIVQLLDGFVAGTF